VFDILRKRKQNEINLSYLRRKLTDGNHLRVNAITSPDTFTTDVLPGMRIVLPDGKTPSMLSHVDIVGYS